MAEEVGGWARAGEGYRELGSKGKVRYSWSFFLTKASVLKTKIIMKNKQNKAKYKRNIDI